MSQSTLIPRGHILIGIFGYFLEASLQFIFEVMCGEGGLNVRAIEVRVMPGSCCFASTLKIVPGELFIFEAKISGGGPGGVYLRL